MERNVAKPVVRWAETWAEENAPFLFKRLDQPVMGDLYFNDGAVWEWLCPIRCNVPMWIVVRNPKAVDDSQGKVFQAIKGERDYQDQASTDGTRPDILQEVHIGDLLGAIKVNVDRAYEAWYSDTAPYGKTMDYLRKVAALCVRAGEVLGMPERESHVKTA